LDRVQALAVYQGAIKDLIAAFKYQHVKDLGAVGAYYLYQFCQLPAPAAAINFVSFVPIHRRRYRERGFNQSRLLAQHFAARAHLSFSPLLRRDLYREKQALSKDKAERQAKVRGVFSLSAAISPAALQGATVLLIDDVVTTGATLNECARVLKKAGVSQVYALCLAHGM
jgi:ComF family protein